MGLRGFGRVSNPSKPLNFNSPKLRGIWRRRRGEVEKERGGVSLVLKEK
jgi:hypothetical protein